MPVGSTSRSLFVYVGVYTHNEGVLGGGESIYIYRLDGATGAMTLLKTAQGAANASFMAVTPRRTHLYAVNELTEYAGQPGGAVSAFAVDRRTGELTFLNQQPTHGGLPCYVTLDPSGRWLLVTNYLSGSVTVLPIDAGGALGKPSAVVEHTGSGPHPHRQDKAYAHSVIFDPSQRLVLVADLGIDKIMLYRLDAERGVLAAADPPWCAAHPGAGPRHMVFHPNQRFLYVANELDSSVTALAYDMSQGTLREMQSLTTLPAGFGGENTCADIHILPSGKFVYVSNRGHDSIAIFAAGEDGRLTVAGHAKTQGRCPRNFGVTPSGDMMLVANQLSDSIVAFRIDQATGQLALIGQVAQAPTPVFVGIVEM